MWAALLASVLFAAWGGPLPIAAQEPGAERMTLEEALGRALERNPGFRQAERALEVNALSRRGAWLDVLPQPQLRFLATNMNWRRQTVAEDFFGNPLPNPEVTTVRTSSSSQSAGFSLSLNAQTFMNLRAQDDETRLQELSLGVQRRALESEVKRAFLDVQERLTGLELEERLLENARRNREVARQLWRVGRRDIFDVRQAELDVAEQESQFDQVRSGLETARFALGHAIGDPELREFEIVPVELTEFDPTRLDVEALVHFARTSSPQVVQAEGELEARRRGVNQVRAQWLPTLSFNWSTSRQGFVRGGDAFFDLNPDSDWDRTMSLSILLPDLGQYFRRDIQQAQAGIQLRNQQESVRQARNVQEREVRILITDLLHQHRSLGIQADRAALAQEQLEYVVEGYRIGTRGYLELQSAATQAAQAARQELAARYAFERAIILLEQALGLDLEGVLEAGAGG